MSRILLVIIESPFAGDIAANTAYARECMLDSLRRGEAPFASHLLYTQVLEDSDVRERGLGIAAGLAWGQAADLTAVYRDLGVSAGMRLGIASAQHLGRRVEYRTIRVNPPHWTDDKE